MPTFAAHLPDVLLCLAPFKPPIGADCSFLAEEAARRLFAIKKAHLSKEGHSDG